LIRSADGWLNPAGRSELLSLPDSARNPKNAPAIASSAHPARTNVFFVYVVGGCSSVCGEIWRRVGSSLETIPVGNIAVRISLADPGPKSNSAPSSRQKLIESSL
jgi:hypothetical protein